jgi:hypothetical protein
MQTFFEQNFCPDGQKIISPRLPSFLPARIARFAGEPMILLFFPNNNFLALN